MILDIVYIVYVCTYIYIYIYIEREIDIDRYTMCVYVYIYIHIYIYIYSPRRVLEAGAEPLRAAAAPRPRLSLPGARSLLFVLLLC